MEQQTRRVRAGQPPADLEHWEIDLNELPEEELPDWQTTLIVVGIMLAVGACAALVVRVI
jgi:hypothetical protein